MKRLALALLIAFGAFYLHADDSPLVAAAKASQQAKKPKKKIVITNETLAKTGGHVSTATTKPQPLPKLTDPPIQPAKAVAPVDAAAKAAEEKKKRDAAEHANAVYEGDDAEGAYEDPARTEGRMEKQSPPTPQQPPTVQAQPPPTVQVQKPPV